MQKCPIPIFKTVPILLILKAVQFLFNCKTVPLVSLIAYWSLSSFFYSFSPQVPRSSVQSTCHKVIGSQVHMAAYKQGTVSESEPQIKIQEPHHHKQKRNFSLFSVGSKFTNPEKVQEHSNPNRFSRIEIQHRSYKDSRSSQ